jgi:hypothetical protein
MEGHRAAQKLLLLGSEKLSKAPGTLPVQSPRRAQAAAKQNVGMVARFFVLDIIWIGIFCGDSTVVKEFSALLQIEAHENNRLR